MANSFEQDAAGALANGQWQEAEENLRAALLDNPRNIRALLDLVALILRRADHAEALNLLSRARELASDDPVVHLAIAEVYSRQGNHAEEAKAIEAALVIDPYCLPALLAKGAHLERVGATVNSARIYQAALNVAPPQHLLPPPLQGRLARARTMVEDFSKRMTVHLERETHSTAMQLSTRAQERWSEAFSIASGASKAFQSTCNQLTVPRLPALPFYERSQFPWAPLVEAKTSRIRIELERVLRDQEGDLKPYIDMPEGTPIDQWRELNRSRKWSTYSLWRHGEPVVANLKKCPETAMALAEANLADIDGFCPNAMFSFLAPKTHIPPHHGETNARLVAHLPLIVPEGCWFRVGFERRTWEVGKLLIFDDTIEHEACNESDELRVVLIFDVWNPNLEPGEREMTRRVMGAIHRFSD